VDFHPSPGPGRPSQSGASFRFTGHSPDDLCPHQAAWSSGHILAVRSSADLPAVLAPWPGNLILIQPASGRRGLSQ